MVHSLSLRCWQTASSRAGWEWDMCASHSFILALKSKERICLDEKDFCLFRRLLSSDIL